MPKYRAHGVVMGGKYIGEFEAPTPEEAEAMAWKVADVSLCHECARDCEDAHIDEVIVELVEDEEE
jgi:hypothetical protein